MIPFPADQIHDEETALDWWEYDFAGCCDSLEMRVAAALARSIVGSLRHIRSTSLEAKLTVTQAATESGYSTRQIRRWLKAGKLENVGSDTAPRVRRGDVMNHKKPTLPRHSPIRIMETAQDIARSVATRRSGDG